jgi:CRP-like cAMP-binding protein
MRVEFKKIADIVFHYKDMADKFYIILSGEVGVMIPKTQEEVKLLGNDVGQRSTLRQMRKEDYMLGGLNLSKYFNDNRVFNNYSKIP